MADYTPNNYTLIELLHLSYLIRDSLEYCHEKIQVTKENFDRRAAMQKNMLAPGNFVQKWLENHPNEQIRKFYPELVNYFHDIYEVENYVNYSNYHVDDEKIVDFVEETIKKYQVVEDILKAFLNEFKKTEGMVNSDVNVGIVASFDYYRVICNWLFFNQVLKNDGEYKKAMKESGGKPSYEVNYNLNILKRLIGGFNFNRERYTGDKVDIKNMFEASMNAFKGLDGTLLKDMKESQKKDFTAQEAEEIVKNAVQDAANKCVTCIRIYEPIWKETYGKVVEYMKNNPLNQEQQVVKQEEQPKLDKSNTKTPQA